MPGWVQVKLTDANVQAWAVEQQRGKAYTSFSRKDICFTIPVWVFKRPMDYQVWYVAHEVSHCLDYINGNNSNHGPEFHRILKSICPLESQKYEWEYMKRSISRGLGQPEVNLEDI